VKPATRSACLRSVVPKVGALGDIDISTCDVCGSAVKVIASIEAPVVIKQILAHPRIGSPF